MLAMGSEIGHSQNGNNNAYAQDNAIVLDRLGQGRRLARRLRRAHRGVAALPPRALERGLADGAAVRRAGRPRRRVAGCGRADEVGRPMGLAGRRHVDGGVRGAVAGGSEARSRLFRSERRGSRRARRAARGWPVYHRKRLDGHRAADSGGHRSRRDDLQPRRRGPDSAAGAPPGSAWRISVDTSDDSLVDAFPPTSDRLDVAARSTLILVEAPAPREGRRRPRARHARNRRAGRGGRDRPGLV